MKKRMPTKLKREEGFFSAMVLVFLVTLGLMGVGAAVLIEGESSNVTNFINSKKSDFIAEGAVYYALGAFNVGTFIDTTLEIEGISVDIDTLMLGNSMIMSITAIVNNIERTIELDFESSNPSDLAIQTEGSVSSVTTRDSNNVTDQSLISEDRRNMPEIDNTTLNNLSTSQGHDQSGTFLPTDGYPDTSFYQSDGVTPNVTHVYGDMTVEDDVTIYGIFIVEGDVYLENLANVQGVIYLINQETELSTQWTLTDRRIPSITGGVFGYGDVEGRGQNLYIRHDPEYMRALAQYMTSEGGTEIAHWRFK